MSEYASRLQQILLKDPTGNVRFFFALVTIGYGMFIPQVEGHYMYRLALDWVPSNVWSMVLIINGTALMWGSISNRPSLLLYVLEGWLGAAAWLTLGIATSLAQGMPGPTMFAAFIAGWILVRYPEWK